MYTCAKFCASEFPYMKKRVLIIKLPPSGCYCCYRIFIFMNNAPIEGTSNPPWLWTRTHSHEKKIKRRISQLYQPRQSNKRGGRVSSRYADAQDQQMSRPVTSLCVKRRDRVTSYFLIFFPVWRHILSRIASAQSQQICMPVTSLCVSAFVTLCDVIFWVSLWSFPVPLSSRTLGV